jgi:hypothetical protein
MLTVTVQNGAVTASVLPSVTSETSAYYSGAHIVLYITAREDRSDRYNLKNVQHKYSKVPAWMLHGTIINGRKGPAHF